MNANNKLVVTSIVTALFGAAATLGAAYIGRLDFTRKSSTDTDCRAVFDSRAYPGTMGTLVTINKNDTVSYMQNALTYDATVPRLVADGKQYFTDRRTGTQPFDEHQVDVLGVSVVKDSAQLKMALTLKSWGDTVSTVSPVCFGNFLVATSPSQDAMFVMHLRR